MTWAKFGTEFSAAMLLAGVDDNEYRCHVDAIMWAYQMGGCLEIPESLLPRITGCADPGAAAAGLTRRRLWRRLPEGWKLVHYAREIRESLEAQEAKRVRDKNAQQAKRDRDKAEVRHLRAVAGDGSFISADVSAESAAESHTDRHTDRTDRRTYGPPLRARTHAREPDDQPEPEPEYGPEEGADDFVPPF
jgi:hypothetical protein